jgi:hypothetical protein
MCCWQRHLHSPDTPTTPVKRVLSESVLSFKVGWHFDSGTINLHKCKTVAVVWNTPPCTLCALEDSCMCDLRQLSGSMDAVRLLLIAQMCIIL